MALLSKSIKLSELSSLGRFEQQSRINDLFNVAMNPTFEDLDSQLNDISAKIRLFMLRNNLSYEDALTLMEQGYSAKMAGSVNVCALRMLFGLKSDIEEKIKALSESI